MNMNNQLLDFLCELEREKIHYTLEHNCDEAIMVLAATAAISAPNPFEAPVTIATLSLSRSMCLIPSAAQGYHAGRIVSELTG
jgi:hypothetical protein